MAEVRYERALVDMTTEEMRVIRMALATFIDYAAYTNQQECDLAHSLKVDLGPRSRG
ncbi:hypothetical protein ACWCXC_15640 [Streptomyces sp. NPDC001515]